MNKKDKKNKNLWICCVVAAIAVVAVVVGIVVAKGNGGNNGGAPESGFADELKNVDVEIEYGDYDAMEELSKDIQNGLATGKVVKIDGIVSHPLSFYSVVELNESGTNSIGTRFVIEGETGYPEDEDHVVITGKVIELEPLIFVIRTTKDFVEVQ